MKKILIYSDPLKGHLIPTLGVGEKLSDNNFHVHYMGVPDVTDLLSKTQFPYTTIFEEYYPKGVKYEIGNTINPNVLKAIIEGEFDEVINDASAVIMTAYNTLEALTFYLKYKIKIFLLHVHFPKESDFSTISFTNKVKEWSTNILMDDANLEAANLLINFVISQGYEITTLKDLLTVYDNFYNLIAASEDFLIEEGIVHPNDLYIGTCIPNNDIFNSHYNIQSLKDELGKYKELNKSIIYCSLGSWAEQINKDRTEIIINAIIESMQNTSMDNYILYVSAGNLYDQYQHLGSDTVKICHWLPQMLLLQNSDVAMIHGGMGGIKECIINQVPMLVIPLGHDQFENADRVQSKELGLKMNLDCINEDEIISKISYLQKDTVIKNGLVKMKLSFEKASENKKWMTLL